MLDIEPLFHIDNLSLIMMGLVGFVTISIVSFSSRYLKGDRKQSFFYLNLAILISIIFIMVSADHLFLLLVLWAASNYFLTRLMRHKREWEAARQSSILAIKNFGLGLIFLGSSFSILYIVTGETSIQIMLSKPIETPWVIISGLLMLLATMTQSALWPFHRWLTSSLNSPTPVSAIMHAGLVNGGGFILARFAPMLLEQPVTLNIIFITGVITATLGILWKLMQSDVKRMLACSTMGQMGFMIAQCGLGLFPAAVAHLCWHGLFKAYLFLASGSAAQEQRLDLEYPPSLKHFSMALIGGALGAYMFSLTSGKNIFAADTTLLLILLAMIAGTQFALPILRRHSLVKIPLATLVTALIGALYGLSMCFIEQLLTPLAISNPQPLNGLHLLALFVLTGAWLAILFGRHPKQKQIPTWMLKIYVRMLNASQPHPKTVTAHRNQYQF
ncbi:MAG: proton-conducting membrane transporter [Legionellales bacterium]|nr:proton-conducting membrane transporter [Legionellales bacterium]